MRTERQLTCHRTSTWQPETVHSLSLTGLRLLTGCTAVTRPFAFILELSVFGKLSKLVNSLTRNFTVLVTSVAVLKQLTLSYCLYLFASVAVLKQLTI